MYVELSGNIPNTGADPHRRHFGSLAVSKLMGHAKETITMDVYGDNRGIIADCADEIQPFIDEVLPTEDLDSALQTENYRSGYFCR